MRLIKEEEERVRLSQEWTKRLEEELRENWAVRASQDPEGFDSTVQDNDWMTNEIVKMERKHLVVEPYPKYLRIGVKLGQVRRKGDTKNHL